MKAIATLPAQVAQQIQGVFCDVDDTLTNAGKLGSAAYAALWRLHDAGVWVVPVTGRPAGWCDLMARQWPVKAVVGENGAFAFALLDGGAMQRLYHVAAGDPEAQQARLAGLGATLMREIPGVRIAADQRFRMFDLAVDFAEEMPRLDLNAAAAVKALFESHGATAKISSIHVNGWFGAFDKLSMCQRWAATQHGISSASLRQRWIFCGDSPNDETMFAFFTHAVGVGNVRDFVGHITHWPAYVCERRGGEGFAEVADAILRGR